MGTRYEKKSQCFLLGSDPEFVDPYGDYGLLFINNELYPKRDGFPSKLMLMQTLVKSNFKCPMSQCLVPRSALKYTLHALCAHCFFNSCMGTHPFPLVVNWFYFFISDFQLISREKKCRSAYNLGVTFCFSH